MSIRKQKAKSMRKSLPLNDWLILMEGLKHHPSFKSSFLIQKLYLDIGNDIKAEDGNMIRNYAPNKIDLAALGEIDENDIKELATLSISATQMQDSNILSIKKRWKAKLHISDDEINTLYEDMQLNPDAWTQDELDEFNQFIMDVSISKAQAAETDRKAAEIAALQKAANRK